MKTIYSLILLNFQKNFTLLNTPHLHSINMLSPSLPCLYTTMFSSCLTEYPFRKVWRQLSNNLIIISGNYSYTRSPILAEILIPVLNPLLTLCPLRNFVYFYGFKDHSVGWWISSSFLYPLPLPYNLDTCRGIFLVSPLRH